MKTLKVGIVAVAFLLVVTGVGFGIAHAAGNHSDQPVTSFADQEALEQGSSSNSYVESRPVMSFEAQGLTQVAKSPAKEMERASDGWQTRGPVETGAIPGAVLEESWMKDYGND